MNSSFVFTLGETVYDLLFKNMQPVKGVPGGSTLNTSVSLGRLGLPVRFISEMGKDSIGTIISDFLEKNNVCTDSVSFYEDGATTLSIASLDENNNASYNFYKILPQKHLCGLKPEFKKGDILLLGSYFITLEQTVDYVFDILERARKAGALIVYDPNYRKAHDKEKNVLIPRIMEIFKRVDIIRGSDEDFMNVTGTSTPEDTYEALRSSCGYLIYTSSSHGATWMTPKMKGFVQSEKISPVSTVGAGDTFNAGLIYALYKSGATTDTLPHFESDVWEKTVKCGISLATEVCMSYDNYISQSFAEKFKL